LTPFEHVFKKEDQLPRSISKEFDTEFESEYVYGHGLYIFTLKLGIELLGDRPRQLIFLLEYVFERGVLILVFLHKPTRTVIEADLLFNLPAKEQYSKSPEASVRSCAERIYHANRLCHVAGGLVDISGRRSFVRKFRYRV
jgi:hypothetical protein